MAESKHVLAGSKQATTGQQGRVDERIRGLSAAGAGGTGGFGAPHCTLKRQTILPFPVTGMRISILQL